MHALPARWPAVTPAQGALVLFAGVVAGTMNAAVGSGSLITFPALLACGFPPVVANVSNNIGLVPGGLASVWGYRRELADQGGRLLRLGSMSVLGGVTGAVLLLVLPPRTFQAVVPVLLGVAVLMVLVQPWLQRRLVRHAAPAAQPGDAEPTASTPTTAAATVTSGVRPAAMVATAVIGVYGGYFGGAQGILLVGAFGALIVESLQRLNALKNGMVTLVNAVAAVAFLVIAPGQVDWRVVGLIALGSAIGGLVGSRVGRRLPQPVLRWFIVLVGLAAIGHLVTG